jgi:hypothetical protein
MMEMFWQTVSAPARSAILLCVSIAYVLFVAVNTYDVRLIQAKTKGFYSGVAARAQGRQLANWVSLFHILSFVALAVVVLMNWRFAIMLFAGVFILKVVPLLEVVGELIMRPFLLTHECENDIPLERANQNTDSPSEDLESIESELMAARRELGKNQIEIERFIHSLKPDAESEQFIPPFSSWVLQVEDQDQDIDSALINYIREFGLLADPDRNESERASIARTKLKILESSDVQFGGSEAADLDKYKESLRLIAMMDKTRRKRT